MVVTVASVKGGTGKTTLVYTLAGLFAAEGKKVLVVDLDPQANLTFAFIPPDRVPEEASSARLFQRRPLSPLPVADNLFLLGASLKLVSYDSRPSPNDWRLPSIALAAVRPEYSVVLIDTPTGLRPLTKAGLFASEGVIAVADPSPFAVLGLLQLAQGLAELRERGGKAPALLGVVVNMVDRTKVCEEVLATLETLVGRGRVLGQLPRTVRVKHALMHRQSVHLTLQGTPFAAALATLKERLRKEGMP